MSGHLTPGHLTPVKWPICPRLWLIRSTRIRLKPFLVELTTGTFDLSRLSSRAFDLIQPAVIELLISTSRLAHLYMYTALSIRHCTCRSPESQFSWGSGKMQTSLNYHDINIVPIREHRCVAIIERRHYRSPSYN